MWEHVLASFEHGDIQKTSFWGQSRLGWVVSPLHPLHAYRSVLGNGVPTNTKTTHWVNQGSPFPRRNEQVVAQSTEATMGNNCHHNKLVYFAFISSGARLWWCLVTALFILVVLALVIL